MQTAEFQALGMAQQRRSTTSLAAAAEDTFEFKCCMEAQNGSVKNYVGVINQDTLLIKSTVRDKVLKEICIRGIKVDQSDTVSLYNEDAEIDDANVQHNDS